jgi:protein tyrosine phosphatase
MSQIKLVEVKEEPRECARNTLEMSKISDHLYVSDMYSAMNEHLLRANRIQYVLRVIDFDVDDDTMNMYAALNIDHATYLIEDSPIENLYGKFNVLARIIDEKVRANMNVLVHCFAGASRSVSVAAAYLLKKYYDTLSLETNIAGDRIFRLIDILDEIKSKRECADPNTGFIYQLHKYELDLINRISDRISV